MPTRKQLREDVQQGRSNHEVRSTEESVLAWIRTRAPFDEAMRRAAAARTAEPPPAERSTDVTVVDGRGREQPERQSVSGRSSSTS